uniref:EGF-like domain-containing protein n=1 Tax=Branchiostoma floridae TaxID=7739 RepID=C3ZLS0_BRAFL|eukprot:XP_002590532.1 hypothetical protein BRAFLDRAFT_86204 [Branchiostoma floridae]
METTPATSTGYTLELSYAPSNKTNGEVPTETKTFNDSDPLSPGVGKIESPSLSPEPQTSDKGGARPAKSLLGTITRGTNHTENSNNSSGGNYGVENKDVMKWLERQSDRLILKDNEEQLDDGSGLTAPAIDKSTDADNADCGYPASRDKIDDSRKETKMKSTVFFLKLPKDDNDFLDDAESTLLAQSTTKRSNSSSGSTFVNEKLRQNTSVGSVGNSRHDGEATATSFTGTRNDSTREHHSDLLDKDAPASDMISILHDKLSPKLEKLGLNKSLTIVNQNKTSDMTEKIKSSLGKKPKYDSLKTLINSTAANQDTNAKETVNHLQQTGGKMPDIVPSSLANATTERDGVAQKAVQYELSKSNGRGRNMMKTRDSITGGDGLPLMPFTSRGSSLSIVKPKERDSASTFNGTVNKPIRSRQARLTTITRKTYRRGNLPLKHKKYGSTGRGSKYKRPNSDTFNVKGRQFNNLMTGSKDDFGGSDLPKSSLAIESAYSSGDSKTHPHDVNMKNHTQHSTVAVPLATRNDSFGKSGSKIPQSVLPVTHAIKGSSFNEVFGKVRPHVPSVPSAKGQLSTEETFCDASICQQDGVCIQRATGFFCKCPILYYGRFCELSNIDVSGLNATKTSITVKWGIRNISRQANYTVKVSDEVLLRAVQLGDDVDVYTFDGLKPGRVYNTCVSVDVGSSTQKIKDGAPPAGTFCINVQTEKEADLFYQPLYAIHIFAVTATVFLAIMVFVTLLTIFQTRRYSLLIDQVLYDDTIVI